MKSLLSTKDDTINLPLRMNFTEGMMTPWDIGKTIIENNTVYEFKPAHVPIKYYFGDME